MRLLRVIVILILGCCPVAAREYEVFGPEGGIAFKISLPEGFNPKTDRCPMVILMHGIFSSKDYNPMPALAKGLAQAGIASIRFDFDGHGKSEGRKQDMTIEKELSDARAIWEYVRALPYVDRIGLLGHSQGGVIASMTAGRLSAEGTPPDGLVLIAPGSVIKEACQAGKFFNARFNPADPPEYIRCWGLYKLGREYLLTTQQLDIYGTASAYDGPVRVIHGTRDSIVPMWCSEKFVETYGDRAGLVVVEGENHTITRKRKEVVASVVQFFKGLGRSCVNSCKRTVDPREDSSDFVAITDVVPDVILEIRYYGTYNFVGTRIDGYKAPTAWLTREAADSLKAVSDDVIKLGYRLKIYDAYRPQCAVDHFVRWSKDPADTLTKRYFYPMLDKPVLFEQDYIMEKSGHTRGSTVDLTLFDMTTEKEVDMGGTFDWFGQESHPDYTGITPEQYANRMILRDAMLRHGFKPLDSEWWHFTLRNEPYPDTYFTFPVR